VLLISRKHIKLLYLSVFSIKVLRFGFIYVDDGWMGGSTHLRR
jgi:hypothetical protein